MKKLSTYLLLFFMILFWIFRIIVTITASMAIDIGFSIPNETVEVVLLFVTVVLMVLVIKRKLIGAIAYLIIHAVYYGPSVWNSIMSLTEPEITNFTAYNDLLVGFVALIIPVAILLDMLFDRNRQNHPKDKKTDWFYQNKEYDRKLDERSDKNNYRTM